MFSFLKQVLLLWLIAQPVWAADLLPLRHLQQDLQQARAQGKIILLEVSASYCTYCLTLEEEIIQPMLISGDYEDIVLFRYLSIDSYQTLIDAQGQATTPGALSSKWGADLTPTLLFLGGSGEELAERMVGVYSLDYYGYFVDQAIAEALKKQRQ